MNSILERILYFAEYQNIKITNLEKKIGASKGVLSRAIAKNTDIQLKWIVSLVENYPQLNTEWLILGKSSMLKIELEADKIEENHTPYSNNINFQEKYYQCIEEKTALCDKNQQLYEDVIKLQKEIIQMQRDYMPLKKTPATTTDNVCQV